MRFDLGTIFAHLATGFTHLERLLVRYVERLRDARRQRIAHETEFYRRLKTYCQANGLPDVNPDDWRTGR